MNRRSGLAAILVAYAVWGLFPVYWRALGGIDATELLALRLVLTALSCLPLLPLRRSWPDFRAAWRRPPVLWGCLAAALLLAANWFAFIWAVNNGRVMESSLGYFLCPLFSVLLGRFVEKESMGPARWAAVALAAAGVGVIVAQAGVVPVAGLVIALTWGGYGLLKKRSPLGPVTGLTIESLLLTPPAVLGLLGMAAQAPLTVLASPPPVLLVLLCAGLVTALPLIAFAYGAQRVPLSTLGMGQYLVPSAHFGLAILYGEPVNRAILGGFALIWLGLALYSGNALTRRAALPE